MKDESYKEYQKAMHLAYDSKYIEAIKIMRQIDDDDLEIKFMLAKLLLKVKSTRNEGIKLLKELLETPSWKYAAIELGKIEYGFGHYEEAEKYFNRILNDKTVCFKKDKAYARLELGKVAVMKGDHNSARYHFNKLLKGNEKDISCATLELAKLEEIEGNLEKAKELLNGLVTRGEQNALYALYELGKIATEEEDYLLAHVYYDKLYRIGYKKDRALAQFGIAKIELAQGHDKMAYMLLEQIKDEDEIVKGNVILELGKLDVKQGNYDKARRRFNKLLDRSYGDMIYAKLELGKLAVVEEDYDKAKVYFISLLTTPNKSFALLELGKLAVKMENYELARSYFNKLLEVSDRGKIWAIVELEKLNEIEGIKTITKKLEN